LDPAIDHVQSNCIVSELFDMIGGKRRGAATVTVDRQRQDLEELPLASGVEVHGVAFRRGDWLTVVPAAEPPLTRP
jgi:hypothetical protein